MWFLQTSFDQGIALLPGELAAQGCAAICRTKLQLTRLPSPSPGDMWPEVEALVTYRLATDWAGALVVTSSRRYVA